MHFDQLLARVDDLTLQQLLGGRTLRLLAALDEKLASPTNLKRALVELKTPEGLLQDPASRTCLTDLLRPQEAEQLSSALGLDNDQDPYGALRQANVRSGSEREAALLAFFGLSVPEIDATAPPPALSEALPAYTLFAHQRRALSEVQQQLCTPPHRVIFHMPTGAGKTRTAMNIIAEHLREHEPGLVIWLAYSEELCEQAAQEFERAWGVLGNRSVNVHRFWGQRLLDLDQVRDGIIVAGLAKIFSVGKRDIPTLGKLSSRSTLIVIDEAHQSIAETYRLTLETLLALRPGTQLLGLTATPGRTYDNVDADEELARFFEKQKVMLHVEGYSNPIDYLISEGYLAKPTFREVEYGDHLGLSVSEQIKLRDALDIPSFILDRLAEDDTRTLHILHEVEELAKHHERILLFATTVEHAKLIAMILQARGYTSASIVSGTSPAQRALHIDRFKSDAEGPMILCNYGVLTTGFDAPRTSAALIARPTKSLVLYSQMVGRAIRGPRAGGNAKAEIITVLDTTLPGFGDVAEAFTNWEDVWS